jgi:cyanophycinase
MKFVQPLSRGVLLPIGGAEDKTGQRLILRHFVELCGESPRIAVIPTASAFALDTGDHYCRIFTDLGVRSVECLHIDDRQHADQTATAARLEQVNGIFISGGDQLKLTSLIVGTRLGAAIRRRWHEGIVVAGTSAGASAMSRQMIAFGRSGAQPSQRMVQLASGLGLADNLIIDQHFTQRQRMGRLLTAVALNPGMIGVGIDENTALDIHPDGCCHVVGVGTVTIIDGRQLEYTNIHRAKRHDPLTVTGAPVTLLTCGAQHYLSADVHQSTTY